MIIEEQLEAILLQQEVMSNDIDLLKDCVTRLADSITDAVAIGSSFPDNIRFLVENNTTLINAQTHVVGQINLLLQGSIQLANNISLLTHANDTMMKVINGQSEKISVLVESQTAILNFLNIIIKNQNNVNGSLILNK